MNRDLEPVFFQARTALESVLEGYGFSLYGESHHPGSFGSAEAEYRGRGLRIQLVWDGKDRWLWLRVTTKVGSRSATERDWEDLETALGEPALAVGSLRPGGLANRRIQELVAHARQFLDRAPAV